MDKLSLHQQDILGGIMEELSGRADITIRMHYQSIEQDIPAMTFITSTISSQIRSATESSTEFFAISANLHHQLFE